MHTTDTGKSTQLISCSPQGTIQKYVDDFLSTILTVNDKLPLAVKWLFDLLDSTASSYGITDPEVIHAWKSNRYAMSALICDHHIESYSSG